LYLIVTVNWLRLPTYIKEFDDDDDDDESLDLCDSQTVCSTGV